jgi:hypothetical protein
MNATSPSGRLLRLAAVSTVFAFAFATVAAAQQPPAPGRGNPPAPPQGTAPQPPAPGRGTPPPSPQAAAPIDLTGYWVSIVSEDWRWRMVTPAKGDYASVPLNEAAKKVADSWDPAKDEATGLQCKSYGAPALMRVPGRLHITWQDQNTLRVESDAGMQVRLLRFGRPAAQGPRTWQGQSVAEWRVPRGRGGRAAARPANGSLNVVTTGLRAGYLRKNGIPYSEGTTLTEFWDLFKEPNGEQWITITTLVEDPVYLARPWETALHFKKEPDGSKWDPTPCSAAW